MSEFAELAQKMDTYTAVYPGEHILKRLETALRRAEKLETFALAVTEYDSVPGWVQDEAREALK